MDFVALSQQCAPWVAPETMAAIVKTESAFHPLSIGVNGGAKLSRQPQTKEEAVATAKWLIARGYNIDMGLGQVNYANLSKTGLTVEDVFDPCKNLTASATILHGNYKAAKGKGAGDQAALHSALSAYNTGSFSKGFTNGYVQKVINNAGGTAPEVTAQAVTPVPLFPTEKTGKKPMKPRAQPEGRAARLLADGAGHATPSARTNVYDSKTNSVMVY